MRFVEKKPYCLFFLVTFIIAIHLANVGSCFKLRKFGLILGIVDFINPFCVKINEATDCLFPLVPLEFLNKFEIF